jgi:methylated-DNA-protein-cysteine methyltransferase-like protein
VTYGATVPPRDFEERVTDVLRALKPGEVISYGEVAAEAGRPGAARAVGNLLARGLADVPWWRVVRADGSIVSHHAKEQAGRLASEGVPVVDGRVRRGRAGR